jgi:hypothetical protein
MRIKLSEKYHNEKEEVCSKIRSIVDLDNDIEKHFCIPMYSMNETFITIGLYLMHVYTVIQIKLYMFWMYCFENSLVVHWIRNLMYEIRSRISSYKIEPNYSYMCIWTGEKELYIPIEPVFLQNLTGTFNILAGGVGNTESECLLLMRDGGKIISRIFRPDKKDYNVEFTKSRRHFLSIEYTHPDMPERIHIEIDPAVYLVGNEILSSRFVLRCLQYQSKYYVFDDRYVLDIMDSRIRMLTLKAGEYILIGSTEYEKMI